MTIVASSGCVVSYVLAAWRTRVHHTHTWSRGLSRPVKETWYWLTRPPLAAPSPPPLRPRHRTTDVHFRNRPRLNYAWAEVYARPKQASRFSPSWLARSPWRTGRTASGGGGGGWIYARWPRDGQLIFILIFVRYGYCWNRSRFPFEW